MPAPARFSPLVTHTNYTLRAEEIHREKAREMFFRWVRGHSLEAIGEKEHLPANEVHKIVTWHVSAAMQAWRKWKLAEIRCKAMAMELRMLRIGKDAPPDQPLETLDPPDHWLRSFKNAGIDTVNQLRSVDSETLYAHWTFPAGALYWAITKLDKLGLSHILAMRVPKRIRGRRSAPRRIPAKRLYYK